MCVVNITARHIHIILLIFIRYIHLCLLSSETTTEICLRCNFDLWIRLHIILRSNLVSICAVLSHFMLVNILLRLYSSGYNI
jgi:hypothetical protein